MLRSTLVLASLAQAAAAQFFLGLEISEVRVNPLPGGHQAIEGVVSNAPLDTTGWHLVVGTTAVPLPAVQLPANGVFVLRLGVTGTTTGADLFVPGAPPLGASDSIALFRSATTTVPADLLDYVAWGGAVGPHAAMAVQAGRWSSVSASATLPAAAGATLANRRITRTATTMVGPDAWYADTTPTIGTHNDPAMTWNHGAGCLTPNPPGIGVLSQDPGPWLGEPATLVFWPVTSFALVVLSTTPTQPIPLDAIGMPACFANQTIEATALVPVGVPYTQYVYTVPANPLLTRFEFYLQAFVPDPTAGNAMGARVTNSVTMLVGSR